MPSKVNVYGWDGTQWVPILVNAEGKLIIDPVALDPALNAYPEGYHKGAVSLTAVDADLISDNIKLGVTVFGVVGTMAAGVTPMDGVMSVPLTGVMSVPATVGVMSAP